MVRWLRRIEPARSRRTEGLDDAVREPLLDAVAERIRTRTRMDDRAARRYVTVLRLGQRR